MFSNITFKLKLVIVIFSTYNLVDQVMTAIKNLRNPPVVDSTMTKTIHDVGLPVVTICPINQTNFVLLNKLYGNKSPNEMLAGFAYCQGKKCLSWGNHLNMSHQELLHSVYNAKLAQDLEIKNIISQKLMQGSLVFLQRFGFCKEISNFNTSAIRIRNKNIFTPIRIFITDKTYRSHVSLDYSSHNGNMLEISEIGVLQVYVKMRVVSSCKIVPPMKFDYQECVNIMLERDIGAQIGCLPPWMTDFNQCNSTYPNDVLDDEPNYWQNIIPYSHLRNSIQEQRCKKACRKTNNFVSVSDKRIDETFFGRNENSEGPSGRAIIHFDEQVEVTEKTFNYSYYNFIIDVGSSMGLWFGLSVFGIFDLLIETFQFVKNMLKKR